MLAPSCVLVAPMMTTVPPPPCALDAHIPAQPRFKKHKALPRPRRQTPACDPLVSVTLGLAIEAAASLPHAATLQPSSPSASKHGARSIAPGPDLPPTPPNHSRNSSSSHPAPSSSPPINDAGLVRTSRHAMKRSIATPPDQRSPPTPDVTPPGPASRSRALRPSPFDRGLSRVAATDSQSDSFTTAREEPLSSEDEGGSSTVRPLVGSAATSRNTLLQTSDTNSSPVQPDALDLALALEQLRVSPRHASGHIRPTKREFAMFDGGDRGSLGSAVREWQGSIRQAVAVEKRPAGPRPMRSPRRRTPGDVLEASIPSPTGAAKDARQVSLRNVATAGPSPERTAGQTPRSSDASVSTSVHVDARPSPAQPTRLNSLTIVEAFLVVSPPQRHRTLRHVPKMRSLRGDSCAQREPTAASPGPDRVDGARVGVRAAAGRRHGGYALSHGTNSLSSGRARREVWKNGGIPVVVVPSRRSSSRPKSSREPSLRSTSSKRSRRSLSTSPTLPDVSPIKHVSHDRQPRQNRSRPVSDLGPLDQRTLDFPPMIPPRSSSLSAPTSRNASRAGSLTADSLRALANLHQPSVRAPEEDLIGKLELEPSPLPEVDVHSLTSTRLETGGGHDFPSPGQLDDGGSPKRYSSRNTPFSIASVETMGTAPEVSEALAVHMYPHQNSSVIMVNHFARPSELPSTTREEACAHGPKLPPEIMTTSPDGGPVAPQQPGSKVEVGSPLRDPRPPPQPPRNPPAINFIPATPSGATPAHERLAQLGNYFEATGERPPRRPSMVRRAFSRRRHSIGHPPLASRAPIPSFITRTFSLSRSASQGASAAAGKDSSGLKSIYPQEDMPSDESRLHPFWRPHWFDDEPFECDGRCDDDDHDHGEIYRYPPVDNRPRMPTRSLSARMKKTFAIFPARDDEYYLADSSDGPERRTIRRTASGNLKVMRHRPSLDSLKWRPGTLERSWPWSRGGVGGRRQCTSSLRRRASKERMRRAFTGNRPGGFPGIPRLLSERRREKRTRELRQMISRPKEVRDGVGDVIEPKGTRGRHYDGNAVF